MPSNLNNLRVKTWVWKLSFGNILIYLNNILSMADSLRHLAKISAGF